MRTANQSSQHQMGMQVANEGLLLLGIGIDAQTPNSAP